MKKFIKFLEDTIESNSTFMDVCENEQHENPGAKFPYKKYFTSLGEINLAKAILAKLEKAEEVYYQPKNVRDMVKSIDDIKCAFITFYGNNSPEEYKCIKFQIFRDSYEEFLDELNFIAFNTISVKGTIWTLDGHWYEVTNHCLVKHEGTPKIPF